jgi:hypothetical protein
MALTAIAVIASMQKTTGTTMAPRLGISGAQSAPAAISSAASGVPCGRSGGGQLRAQSGVYTSRRQQPLAPQ